MQKITPCLWFDGNALEAANFYASLFKNAKVLSEHGEGHEGAGVEGKPLIVRFEIEGLQFMGLNGGPYFHFTEAISLMVDCKNQEEVDELWEGLSDGGEKSQCGWLKDKYGLSWQIVPSIIGEMMSDPDPVKAGRVMQALMKMTKPEIDALKRAYETP